MIIVTNTVKRCWSITDMETAQTMSISQLFRGKLQMIHRGIKRVHIQEQCFIPFRLSCVIKVYILSLCSVSPDRVDGVKFV